MPRYSVPLAAYYLGERRELRQGIDEYGVFATLPASPYLNQTATINDSTTNAIGAIAAGGGTYRVTVKWDGANWRVA